ncbi:hypothetical protein BpHYR1_020823 [Brachionus plicatilis]|uniref:Uncharacterized protein n=1 Tax=Brachionus plicatilis TaxID=10195 RepID=A0A3M7PJK5_BRAPC|nr:hypothetical protein BpHYR1_020823 [Brachionus plicatilis]
MDLLGITFIIMVQGQTTILKEQILILVSLLVQIIVSKQNGSIDCGLFALGYALALAINIDPEITFDLNLYFIYYYLFKKKHHLVDEKKPSGYSEWNKFLLSLTIIKKDQKLFKRVSTVAVR